MGVLTADAIDDVIAFWFDELAPSDWWGGDALVDERIRTRFAPLLDALRADPPPASSLDARGHLAAVVVLDQFPRNLYRGSAAAFASDAQALALTIDAIDRGLDVALTASQRHFLYMPLMHAEDASVQARSLAMFETLGEAHALRSARGHADTIARFGRFPYRNAALGRVSTDDERAFLAKHPSPE